MVKIKVGLNYYIGINDIAMPYRQACWLLKNLEVTQIERGIYQDGKSDFIVVPSSNKILKVLDLNSESWSFEDLKRISQYFQGIVFGRLRSLKSIEEDADSISCFWVEASGFLKKSKSTYEIISVEKGLCERVGYILLNNRIYVAESVVKVMMIEVLRKNKGYGTKAINFLRRNVSVTGLAVISALPFWERLASVVDTNNVFTINKEEKDEKRIC